MLIKNLVILINLLVFTVMLSGCAKFLKSESENITPFANQTILLVSSLDYGLSANEILYLRKIEDYVDTDKPFDRYNALETQVGNHLKVLVAYSLQMVTISEQNITENEKSNKLADILVSLSALVAENEIVPEKNRHVERNKDIMTSVRASEDYLESLRILLPAINDFSAHALEVLDEFEIEKRKVTLLLEEAIDKKYGAAIAFEHEIRLIRNSYYKSLIALSNYVETRDVKYIKEMREHGVLLVVEELRNKKSLTSKEMLKLHKIISDRMEVINGNYANLKPDFDEFFSSRQELKKIVETKDAGIKEARLTFIIWSRAYQKMALGKTDPAEWFDISESGGLLMGAAGRAAGL